MNADSQRILHGNSDKDKIIVLSIDCSTTAVKAILWDTDGKIISMNRIEIPLNRVGTDGFEQDAEMWWTHTCNAIKGAVEGCDIKRISGLCVTHQRETFVIADRLGNPLRPAIVWMDQRCKPQVRFIRENESPDTIHRITGKPVCATPSFYKILWLKENEPEIFSRDFRILDVHAFLIHRLTARFATSIASADPMGLIDLKKSCWSPEILSILNCKHAILPELFEPGKEIGRISSEASKVCGLPSGLPVIAGAGDGQSAGLGAGCVESTYAYLNLGTAIVSGVYSEEYLVHTAFRTMAGAISGTYLLETDLKGGTFTVNWLLDKWLLSKDAMLSGHNILESLEKEASILPPGSENLVVMPYWCGVMNPFWDDDATGLVMGWRDIHGPAHLYRAILEGIAMEQRRHTSGVETAAGTKIDEFIAMGGGASSSLWCQIIADVCGKRVKRSAASEATSLGAAILSTLGIGFYANPVHAIDQMTSTRESFDSGDNSEVYQNLYNTVYEPLFPAVKPLMDRLSNLRQ